jgi:hypothetical protein
MDRLQVELSNWTSNFGKSGSKKENCGTRRESVGGESSAELSAP